MKVFTSSEARRKFSKILEMARSEDILIKRRDGEVFSLTRKNVSKSPFDVPGIKTEATMSDILDAVRESRSRN